MPNIYKADLQKAKAEAKIAEIEYQNTKLLEEGNVVSKNELAQAKATYEKALAEVALAETHLSFTNIKAPFSGVLYHLTAEVGDYLASGDSIISIIDYSKIINHCNLYKENLIKYVS